MTTPAAPLDEAAMHAARERLDILTKPPGSLGRIETLAIGLCGISGRCPPPPPAPAVVGLFAGDHGVVHAGVTGWPQEITAQMVANICGGGAAASVLADEAGADLRVIDVGVAGDVTSVAGVLHRKVRPGTADLSRGPAMSVPEAEAAIAVGAEIATAEVAGGAGVLLTGEMGIGNTTPAAALIAACTGEPAARVTGRGTGVDDATLARKVEVVERAVIGLDGTDDPVALLAAVGGLEIAALAGFAVAGVAAGVPVVVDGLITLAALVVAERLQPGTKDRCIAAHRSVEPGATVALAHLDLDPLLELDLRLGEGTGALLALPLVRSAARILTDMATLDMLS